MSRSLHTQKLELRAARRLARPYAARKADAALLGGQDAQADSEALPERRLPIRVQKPLPGLIHPLHARDIRGFLEAMGPTSMYGVKCIRLRSESGVTAQGIVFGEYLLSGEIHLYAVPSLTWKLPFEMHAADLADFARYGCRCEIDALLGQTTLAWSLAGLRDYTLYEVLAHELGHHLLQYHKGKRPAALCRRSDHELRATLQTRRMLTYLKRDPSSL